MSRMKKNTSQIQWCGFSGASEATLKQIKAAVESTYNDFSTIANAKESILDIFNDIHEKTGIPKKVFNFLAKSNYTGDAFTKLQENTELEDAYNALQNVTI